MVWILLVAVPVLAAYWLRLFGRFVEGDSEREHVDAVRLGLLGLALAFLLAHSLLLAAGAIVVQQVLGMPRPRRAR